MRIYLSNDFHCTTVALNIAPHRVERGLDDITVRPTRYQVGRIWDTLCGVRSCVCGGVRGPQRHAGQRVRVIMPVFINPERSWRS